MTLYIDTTDFSKVTYALAPFSLLPMQRGGKVRACPGFTPGEGVFKRIYKIDPHQSHETLAKMDEFLQDLKIENLKLKIEKILVNKGPGSYTGVRVGVTHALALGFAWNVPVKAVPKEKFVILLT